MRLGIRIRWPVDEETLQLVGSEAVEIIRIAYIHLLLADNDAGERLRFWQSARLAGYRAGKSALRVEQPRKKPLILTRILPVRHFAHGAPNAPRLPVQDVGVNHFCFHIRVSPVHLAV